MQRFESQVAVVTGGADGIGRAIAERMAGEGAHVVLFDRDADRARATAAAWSGGPGALDVAVGDVGEEDDVHRVLSEVDRAHGRLDVLVHCAGIVGPNGVKAQDVRIEDFDEVYRVNLRSSFLVVKHALPPMVRRDYGRILLFASIAGKEGNAGMCAYSTSKAGVIGLVKAVGKEYAETGVTVNAITPAVIRTAMVASMDPGQVRYMTDKIPMKRCGTLEEVAALSTWIVSPEASFNTANVFDLTGGRATY